MRVAGGGVRSNNKSEREPMWVVGLVNARASLSFLFRRSS